MWPNRTRLGTVQRAEQRIEWPAARRSWRMTSCMRRSWSSVLFSATHTCAATFDRFSNFSKSMRQIRWVHRCYVNKCECTLGSLISRSGKSEVGLLRASAVSTVRECLFYVAEIPSEAATGAREADCPSCSRTLPGAERSPLFATNTNP